MAEKLVRMWHHHHSGVWGRHMVRRARSDNNRNMNPEATTPTRQPAVLRGLNFSGTSKQAQGFFRAGQAQKQSQRGAGKAHPKA